MAEMARQNMEMWAKMQASMLSSFAPGTPADKAARNEPPPKRRR
jgi:hypothetical protein